MHARACCRLHADRATCGRPLLVQVFARLYASDGRVVDLPTGELSSRGVAVAANDSAYLGCAYGLEALMEGNIVGLLDDVAAPEDCCRECRGAAALGGPDCNVRAGGGGAGIGVGEGAGPAAAAAPGAA